MAVRNSGWRYVVCRHNLGVGGVLSGRVASGGLAANGEGVRSSRFWYQIVLISRNQSPTVVSIFCNVEKRFRQLYHSGGGPRVFD